MHDVFNHDHRAVDDDAEIHRAQAQQISRHAHDFQAEKGRQQGQWNYHHHRQTGANVGQKQIQHQRHQQRAFDQIFKHRGQCFAHQPSAVVVGQDLHAFRQTAGVEFGDLVFDTLQHDARVFTFAHDHDAGDDVVVLVLADDAEPRHSANLDVGDVANQDRRGAARRHNDAADVVG